MKVLENAIQYPFDAQFNSFFNAISTALLPVLGLTADTPFYCSCKNCWCIQCGECGKEPLQKHHLMLYHALLTATGVAFCFDYPEDDDVSFHSMPGAKIGWRWPDEFVTYIMDLCGCTYARMRRENGREIILRKIQSSIDQGYPVAVRFNGDSGPFGPGTAWCVITGYDEDTLIGLDSHFHYLSEFAQYENDLFKLADWESRFLDAIVITGRKAPAISFRDVLTRIADTLSHPSHQAFQSQVFTLIDNAGADNAQLFANILCSMAGVPIEARWHAAEAMSSVDNVLMNLTDDVELKSRLGELLFSRYLRDNSDETHGVCWKIWGLLDCGPKTGYSAGANASEQLRKPETKTELNRLWKLVFDNDEAVLQGIHKILSSV